MRGQKLREGIRGHLDPVIGNVLLYIVDVRNPVFAQVRRWENDGRKGRRLERGSRPGRERPVMLRRILVDLLLAVEAHLVGGVRQADTVSESCDLPSQM